MLKIKIPEVKIKIGNKSKKNHHHRKNSSRRSKKKRLPGGNWFETARNIKIIKRNLLQAELKNKNGIYILSTTYYKKGDIFENIDGSFVLVSSNYDPRKTRKTFNSRYYSRYYHGKYTKENFNVYFNNKLTNINAMTFEDLGHGYARDAFSVYYKGKKIKGAFHLKFQVLGREYAKDPFNVYECNFLFFPPY